MSNLTRAVSQMDTTGDTRLITSDSNCSGGSLESKNG